MSDYGATDADAIIGGPQIGLNVTNSSPPVNSYVGVDDQLRLFISSSSVTGANITLSLRILLPDGRIVPNTHVVPTPASRSGNTTQIPLTEGFILSAALKSTFSSEQRNTYCVLYITRGTPTTLTDAQVLMQGYPALISELSWPTGFNTDSVNCVGNIRTITGTNPATGTDISETVPASAKWRPISFIARLVTSVAVANRTVVFVIDDGANLLQTVVVNATIPASTTWFVSVGQGLQNVTLAGSSVLNACMPMGVFMSSGWRFRTLSTNLQAGDQWGFVQYSVEEWLTP